MHILKELGKAFLVGILVFIVLGIVRYLNGFVITSGSHFLEMFLYNQLYSVVLYLANAYYFDYLQKQFPNAVFKSKNLLKGLSGGVMITLLSLFLLRVFTEIVMERRDFIEFISNEKIRYYYVSFIISVVVASIFYAVYYYRGKSEKKVTEQKIIAGTASAKFDALKHQLDPHFLFNSLNVLTSLIEENPEAATKFTTSLSKVYRYVLEQKSKDLVTVAEEMDFAKVYMSLLAMRFEDSIVFKFPETLSEPEAKVVPLSLQLILENAVKHNQVGPERKLYITISEEDGNLVVKNNLQPRQVLKESIGVGLKNIRDRYHLLTNQPVVINKTKDEFSISIPMLTKNISIMNTPETFISEKKYKLAKKRVNDLKGFYIHFSIYLLCVPGFIILNIISTSFPWAFFPIIGWGIGVSSHAAETFNYHPFFGKNWEERKIRDIMDKENR